MYNQSNKSNSVHSYVWGTLCGASNNDLDWLHTKCQGPRHGSHINEQSIKFRILSLKECMPEAKSK